MMYDELIKLLRSECVLPYATLKLMRDAADAIEELSRQHETQRNNLIAFLNDKPRWIPVTERLPEHEYGESTSVLTVDLYGVMRVTYFDGGNWCWPTGEALTTTRVAPITHWMPLPEPPNGET